MTNSKTSQCGIYELPKRIIETETGYNRETVDKLLNRFVEYKKIKYCKETGEIFHYDDLVFECLRKDDYLTIGYSALQDLFHYSNMHTFTEALNFIEFIYLRLIDCGNEILEKVGKSYKKWRYEIASAFSSGYKGSRITNSIAENTNNKIKTLYKVGYGYRNFETFRNRIMYILNK